MFWFPDLSRTIVHKPAMWEAENLHSKLSVRDNLLIKQPITICVTKDY